MFQDAYISEGFVFSRQDTILDDKFDIIVSKELSSKPDGEQILSSQNYSSFWITSFFVFFFVAIRCRYLFPKSFAYLFQSIIKRSVSVLLYQERSALVSFMSKWLLPSSFGIWSLVALLFATYFDFDLIADNPISSFFIGWGIFTLLYLYLKAIHLLVGWLFDAMELAKEGMFNVKLYIISTSIILLPFSFIQAFVSNITSVIMVCMIAIIIISLFLWINRGFKIIYEKNVPFFYLILYICTLEVLPMAVLLRYILSII